KGNEPIKREPNSASSQSLFQMLADAKRICRNSQAWIDRGATHNEASIDHIEVVQFVGLTVDIEDRCLWIMTKSQRAALMCRASDRNLLGKYQKVAHLAQHHFQFLCQLLMWHEIIFFVKELQATVRAYFYSIVAITKIFCREPKIKRMVRHGSKKGQWGEW